MPQVLSLGELLVEVMRPTVDQPLDEPGQFVGPFPSGAPAIFIDAVARLGVSCGFIGAVGDDPFGRCVLRRLKGDGVDTRYVRVVSHHITGIAFVSYRSDDQWREAVRNGVVKVNFATEIKDTFMAHLREAMARSESIDIRQVFPPAMQAVTQLAKSKILLCTGQA